MAPLKSSLARTVGKLLGVQKDTDLSLRGHVQSIRKTPFSASGGSAELTPGDGYKYHFFTTNDDFTCTAPVSVDYIVIGGGGAGCGQPDGNNYGGGGAGAGGVRTGTLTVNAGDNPVVVGATNAAPPDAYDGAIGNPSVAFGITAQGGGSGGGYDQATVEYNGGSGGGAPHYPSGSGQIGYGNRVTGTSTPAPSQGNNGGAGGNNASGGGGGAGGVGGDSSAPETGGKGGLGIAFPGWTIPTDYGTPGPNGSLRYFAGGGGGGGNSTGGAAPDGGGGGAGASSADAGHGTANTGGGGGSCGGNNDLDGGDGGSGIVICRYTV